jgi:hypothetical protein
MSSRAERLVSRPNDVAISLPSASGAQAQLACCFVAKAAAERSTAASRARRLEAGVLGCVSFAEEVASGSRQPERALESTIDLRQQPGGQFANRLFQREAVDGGELADVDD